MKFILASKSPARHAVLVAAGVDPEVIVSGVNEEVILQQMAGSPASDQVLAVARAKAERVAGDLPEDARPSIVIGCDSMFAMNGEVRGKPVDSADAVTRLKQMRGNTGVLLTGHWIINSETAAHVGGVASTTVTIGQISDAEIDAYVGTGEPLQVAGSFTIDGLGGWFVDRIDGDHTNVIGISLPLVRTLLRELDVDIASTLWHRT